MSIITPDQMEVYRRTARARLARERQAAAARREQALAVARAAAQVLKDQYGATRVIAYGSLLDSDRFGPDSDIDIAAQGIPPAAFWRAWCALDRVSAGFEINLIALEIASGGLLDQIRQNGMDL
jgi:predicted nucleotidyltransferase